MLAASSGSLVTVRFSIGGAALICLVAVAVHHTLAWRRGDDVRIPGLGIVRRFPCGDYALPTHNGGTTQAFAVIDSAALAAQSNRQTTVGTLVDATFDRTLPTVRCGSPLRRRVTQAEWQFRQKIRPPVSERALVDAANEVLANAAAPSWARVTVEEVHDLRERLRSELPRFIGRVDSDLRLSDRMSPAEAVFLAMTLGRAMWFEREDFRDGPEGYLQHVRRQRLESPVPSGKGVSAKDVDFIADIDRQDRVLGKSVQRFLDDLGLER
jgi:hypothetical protein